MQIHINNERLVKIKKIADKWVLVVGLPIILIGSSLTGLTTEASAEENTDYYQSVEQSVEIRIESDDELSELQGLTKLTGAYIYNCNITDTTFKDNPNLTKLKLTDCNIDTASLPTGLTAIEFYNCNFSNYNFTNKLTRLQEFTYYGGPLLKNLQFLKNCSNLKKLYLGSCEIKSTAGLESCKQATEIEFDTVGIEKLPECKQLSNLKTLKLYDTCLSDLNSLSGTKIESLDLSNTTVTNIDAIKTMPNLKELNFCNNEMAITPEIYNYIKNHNISSNVTKEDLEIRNKIINITHSLVNDQMSNTEKINTIVDYVTSHMEYDKKSETDLDVLNEYNSHALKYALQGKGCCKNYTALTQALLTTAGIKIYEVKGTSYGNEHIWNLAKVGDNYYWLDSTFIDAKDPYSNMANINDPAFNRAHTPKTEPSSVIGITTDTISYSDLEQQNNQKTNTSTQTNNNPNNNSFVNDQTLSSIDNSDSTIETLASEEDPSQNDVTKESTYNKEAVTNNLKKKALPLGAIIGIATALGGAGIFMRKKGIHLADIKDNLEEKLHK